MTGRALEARGRPRASSFPAGRIAAWLVIGALVAAGGCGYSFRGNLPARIRTVAVPVFVNKTQEPAVENIITSAVVNAFTNGGRLKVVPLGEADAILQGEIVGYQVVALAFDQNATAQQYRLLVTLNVQFRDVKGGEMLWRQDGVQEKADFRAAVGQAGGGAATIGREEGAVREAAADIGRRIVNSAVDRF
jgi:outer membrane lipopolysaccharide assembly protein LptE/RlpB